MLDLSQYKFNLEKSPLDPRDYMMESVYPETVTLPEVWDLRKDMPPVRDQGSQGTCSAQTASAMKEWQEKIDIQFQNYMSPQFVYNLRANQPAEGMYPRDTMEILYKIGIVPEDRYPYNSHSQIGEDLVQEASIYKISGYAQVNTLDSARKALFMNGPIYLAFPVYNPNKMDFWKPDFTGQNILGGHAVCCVGYLKDKLIIRNSWSSGWGDQGYTYLPFIDWGCQWEAWSALDADSNPVTLSKKAKQYKKKRKKHSKKQ